MISTKKVSRPSGWVVQYQELENRCLPGSLGSPRRTTPSIGEGRYTVLGIQLQSLHRQNMPF